MDVPRSPDFPSSRAAFTILEMLVSFAVLAILLVVLTTMISRTSSIWSYTRGQVEQFREAREAFDTLTSKLGEATLNTYFDYEDANGNPRNAATSISFVPKNYGRQSELRFLSGPEIHGESHAVFFQSPTGKTGDAGGSSGARLLNTLGFFVEFGDDSRFLPGFLKSRERLRLMEFCEPSDQLSVYNFTSGGASAADRVSRRWFTDALAAANPAVHIVAENIIALILLPILPTTDQQAGNYTDASLAPGYLYDSTARVEDPNLNPRNQLPPIIRVTMIAMDENSAARLGESGFSELRAAVSSRFSEAADYDKDLRDLEEDLTDLGIAFRVFTSNVILKNAKWSREQKE
jgi:uncharacterized protein (TIGR02599 family)